MKHPNAIPNGFAILIHVPFYFMTAIGFIGLTAGLATGNSNLCAKVAVLLVPASLLAVPLLYALWRTRGDTNPPDPPDTPRCPHCQAACPGYRKTCRACHVAVGRNDDRRHPAEAP